LVALLFQDDLGSRLLGQEAGVDLAVLGLDEVLDILRLDRLGRFQDALQDAGAVELFANGREVWAERTAFTADTMAGLALDRAVAEEQRLAAGDVAFQREDECRLDDGSES